VEKRPGFDGVGNVQRLCDKPFVEWAAQTINKSAWAGAYYRQQRAKGASYEVAVRALAFKWIRILYRCWKDRKPYDELKYLETLRRKGSPLLKYLADPA
jgi:hypothetical protein